MEDKTNISKINQTNSPENHFKMCGIQDIVFRDDNLSFFIFKKTERISRALYIICGFLSDTEPAKFSIKETANLLLKETLNLSNRNPNIDQSLISLLKYFTNVSFLINILRDVGSISNMNADILLAEINMTAEIILKIICKAKDGLLHHFCIESTHYGNIRL